MSTRRLVSPVAALAASRALEAHSPGRSLDSSSTATASGRASLALADLDVRVATLVRNGERALREFDGPERRIASELRALPRSRVRGVDVVIEAQALIVASPASLVAHPSFVDVLSIVVEFAARFLEAYGDKLFLPARRSHAADAVDDSREPWPVRERAGRLLLTATDHCQRGRRQHAAATPLARGDDPLPDRQ